MKSVMSLVFAALFVGAFGHPSCRTAPQNPDTDVPGLKYASGCNEIVAHNTNVTINVPRDPMRVMCTFLRMVHRIDEFDTFSDDGYQVRVEKLADAANVYGSDWTSSQFVASQVAAGQGHETYVDLSRLMHSAGVSHDCGITYSLNSSVVEPHVIQETLSLLKPRAIKQRGYLTGKDIKYAKSQACLRDFKIYDSIRRSQGQEVADAMRKNPIDESGETLQSAQAGDLEMQLVFAYLGGIDSDGFVAFSDLERFLNGKLPWAKTKYSLELSPAWYAAVGKYFS